MHVEVVDLQRTLVVDPQLSRLLHYTKKTLNNSENCNSFYILLTILANIIQLS
jgi:hypothetical protein